MRKLVLALAGAAALGIASGANATVTIDSTSMTAGAVDNDITFAIGYFDIGGDSPFSEWLTWTETWPGNYGIILSTIATINPQTGLIDPATDVDFTNVFLSGGSIVGTISLTPDPGNTDLSETWRLLPLFLEAGTYTFTIQGTRGDTSAFGGNIAFSAIPEPATWGMMLLGFAAVGYQVRRRRRPTLLQVA